MPFQNSRSEESCLGCSKAAERRRDVLGPGKRASRSWARCWQRPTRSENSEEEAGWALLSLGDLRSERVVVVKP